MKIPALPGFDTEAFNRYLQHTGWLMIARVGSLFIKLIITAVVLPNYLGPHQNGILNYPLVLVSFFMAASSLGMDSFVTRQLLQDPGRQHVILGTAFRLRLCAGLLALPLIYLSYFCIAGFAQEPPAAPVGYVGIVSLICVFQSVNIIDCHFQARAQGKYIMYVQVGANLMSAVFKLLFILFQASLGWFIWALLLDVILLSIGNVYMYQKTGYNISDWKFDRPTANCLFRLAWPLAFSAIFITLYMKIDQLMLGTYLGEAALGVYATVVQLSEGWYFIPMAIVTALFPAIMNARRDDPVRYRKRLLHLYELMVVISVAIAATITLVAPIIYSTFYAPGYATGAPVLTVHVWAGVFVFLNVASGQYLIAEGYTLLSLARALTGALVNIFLNSWWIPQYGMIGAAYATLVAYASTALFVIFVPKTRSQGCMIMRALLFIPIIQRLMKR